MEGRINSPSMESERLISRGYTNAEKALAANYGPGDVGAFHRPYKRIGIEKGDERHVMGVDHKIQAVLLDDGKGGRVAWKPEEIGGRTDGSEVYRAAEIELCAGDRIRRTRNDPRLSPLRYPEFAGQPPAAVHTAGFDPLQDEGIAYAEKLKAAGVPVVERHYAGLIHGYFNMGGAVSAAKAAFDAAAADLRAGLHPGR